MGESGARTPGPGGSEDLDGALRARGLRATLQRRLVHGAVVELGHGTPEQVCERVRAIAPSLSPSTVYRTLELLEELGVVSHTHLGHGAPTYHAAEHADHLHLVCRRCGAVQEASATAAAELAAELRRRYGFTPDLTHLAVDGVCRDCAGHPDCAGRPDPAREAPGPRER